MVIFLNLFYVDRTWKNDRSHKRSSVLQVNDFSRYFTILNNMMNIIYP